VAAAARFAAARCTRRRGQQGRSRAPARHRKDADRAPRRPVIPSAWPRPVWPTCESSILHLRRPAPGRGICFKYPVRVATLAASRRPSSP
jgi:hypothetical protein